MKRSLLLTLVLVITIPAYMSFVISRSEKLPQESFRQYDLPTISSFSVAPYLSVWLVQSDTNYLYRQGFDTTGILNSGNLTLEELEDGSISNSISIYNDIIDYKLGLKELGTVVSEQNTFYIMGYKQDKLWLRLGRQGKIYLEDCEFDTLYVKINDWGGKELQLVDDCIIKHIVIEGSTEVNSLYFNCSGENSIESLEVNKIDKRRFEVAASAELLARINFTINGEKVTNGKLESDLPKE